MRAVTKGAFEGLSSRARGEQISSSTAKGVSRLVDTLTFAKGIYFGLGSAGNENLNTLPEIIFRIFLLGASLYSYRAFMIIIKICVMSWAITALFDTTS